MTHFNPYADSLYADVTCICAICGSGYTGSPWNGYCDESLECACDEGESLIYRSM